MSFRITSIKMGVLRNDGIQHLLTGDLGRWWSSYLDTEQGDQSLPPQPVAPSPRTTGFCCHGTTLHVWWGTVVGVICSATMLLTQQTWKSLVCGVILSKAAVWRRSFPPCSGPALPAQSREASQCGRDSTHVSAIPRGPRHRDCRGSSMRGSALWISH